MSNRWRCLRKENLFQKKVYGEYVEIANIRKENDLNSGLKILGTKNTP